jgi:ParB family chromosome partitioning protein
MGKGRATVTNTLRLLQLPAGAQRALAERTISAGHARALLGTPDRTLQDKLVEQITSEGLTVRAVEEIVRAGAPVREFAPIPPEVLPEEFEENSGATKSTTADSAPRRPGPRKLPEPGVLELEDLLSTYLNTRVKVDIQNRRGRLVVEFATLEDLERIYRAMVGDGVA